MYHIRYINPDATTGNVQNADGAMVTTNFVDMAITYALSLSDKFTDMTYVVMRQTGDVFDVAVGVARKGVWANLNDKENN